MPPRTRPSLVVVGGGEPFDRRTWSGSSYWFLSALQAEGALEGAVAARPRASDLIERAASWSRDRRLWRQRYWAQASPPSGLARRAEGAIGTRRAAEINAAPETLLALGAWFQPTGAIAPRLRCCYLDMHLALFLTRPDSRLDRSSRLVRKALDHERRTFDGCDLVFTMSDWLRESIVADSGQHPEKVITVGTGANMELPPAPTARTQEPPRFLFVGMRFERKGGPYLLEAFEAVRRERPDAELWIVGPERSAGEHDGVRWFGRIDRSTPEGDAEIKRLYSQATAFVMPSIFEPAGIVFLEAMANALPCVGVDCCAMPELIENGKSGLLARRGDAEDLAAKMLVLADAPDRASEMGVHGYRRVQDRFSWSKVTARMLDAIEARLSAPAAP